MAKNLLNFIINKTWDGQDPVDKAEIHISLSRGRRVVNEDAEGSKRSKKDDNDKESINQLTKTNSVDIDDSNDDDDEGLVISVDAPFYDEPRVGEEIVVGSVDGLWDYEVVELFFLGMDNKYLEIELAPRGHYLLLLLKALPSHNDNDDRDDDDDGSSNKDRCTDGGGGDEDGERLGEKRKVLKYQLPIYSYTTRISKTEDEVKVSEKEVLCPLPSGRWTGRAFIPKNYLPIPITRFNAYAIHKSDPQRVYMALYPTPKNKYEQPNFHRLHYFQPIDLSHILS